MTKPAVHWPSWLCPGNRVIALNSKIREMITGRILLWDPLVRVFHAQNSIGPPAERATVAITGQGPPIPHPTFTHTLYQTLITRNSN